VSGSFKRGSGKWGFVVGGFARVRVLSDQDDGSFGRQTSKAAKTPSTSDMLQRAPEKAV